MSLRWSVLALIVVAVVGCASRRSTVKAYSMPLTPEEGELVLPALQTVAENMGYTVGNSGAAVTVYLPEGDALSWQLSNTFELLTGSSKQQPTPADHRALKVKADELWDLALELRQKSSVGAAVTITKQRPQAAPEPGYPMPQQPRPPSFHPSGRGRHPASGGYAPAGQCRSSLDCESDQWCRDYRGTKLCIGNSPLGGPCTSGLDCESSLFCHDGVCR